MREVRAVVGPDLELELIRHDPGSRRSGSLVPADAVRDPARARPRRGAGADAADRRHRRPVLLADRDPDVRLPAAAPAEGLRVREARSTRPTSACRPTRCASAPRRSPARSSGTADEAARPRRHGLPRAPRRRRRARGRPRGDDLHAREDERGSVPGGGASDGRPRRRPRRARRTESGTASSTRAATCRGSCGSPRSCCTARWAATSSSRASPSTPTRAGRSTSRRRWRSSRIRRARTCRRTTARSRRRASRRRGHLRRPRRERAGRADRRAVRPDRSVHVLAAPARGRRRRARAGRSVGAGAVRRRARSRRVARPARGARPRRRLQRERARRSRSRSARFSTRRTTRSAPARGSSGPTSSGSSTRTCSRGWSCRSGFPATSTAACCSADNRRRDRRRADLPSGARHRARHAGVEPRGRRAAADADPGEGTRAPRRCLSSRPSSERSPARRSSCSSRRGARSWSAASPR